MPAQWSGVLIHTLSDVVGFFLAAMHHCTEIGPPIQVHWDFGLRYA